MAAPNGLLGRHPRRLDVPPPSRAGWAFAGGRFRHARPAGQDRVARGGAGRLGRPGSRRRNWSRGAPYCHRRWVGRWAAILTLKKDLPEQSLRVVAAAGSFSAISTLLGSPLSGAFLLMEASGLSGPMLGVVLVPGLLAAGIGSLIFLGFDVWTGHGTFSLAIPGLPHIAHPTGAEFGWALVIGIAAVILGGGIRWLALWLKPRCRASHRGTVPPRRVGGRRPRGGIRRRKRNSSSDVLFSGQSALPSLVTNSAAYSVGALLLLIACKGLAYGFRRLPGRPDLPFHVYRGRRRHTHVTPAGVAPGRRGSHGHWCHDDRDARLALDRCPHYNAHPGLGRDQRDASGHRGRSRHIRGPRPFFASPSATLLEQFLRERRYQPNISPSTVSWYSHA